jgi:hypothetical protein
MMCRAGRQGFHRSALPPPSAQRRLATRWLSRTLPDVGPEFRRIVGVLHHAHAHAHAIAFTRAFRRWSGGTPAQRRMERGVRLRRCK